METNQEEGVPIPYIMSPPDYQKLAERGELLSLTVNQLREVCSTLGLAKSHAKEDIVTIIYKHLKIPLDTTDVYKKRVAQQEADTADGAMLAEHLPGVGLTEFRKSVAVIEKAMSVLRNARKGVVRCKDEITAKKRSFADLNTELGEMEDIVPETFSEYSTKMMKLLEDVKSVEKVCATHTLCETFFTENMGSLAKKQCDGQCIVCFELWTTVRRVVLFPCGHSLCESCITKCEHCPQCKKAIKHTTFLYE